eukprot:TRINITY_DN2710_c0_g1_i1.p1 TRINITY_DN2710_c0_g1~~TRINITY_DN2710_c0_g1_i1.p1  ORF type:complete len:151 (-),score=18.27 TRINITY_DN2710_c0_g1_i1:14-466(-)
MSAVVTLTSEFGWVLLSAIAVVFHLALTGVAVGGIRRKLGLKYPDMGSGRYSATLSDKDWETFNNYQRAHYNYIEGIAVILVLLVVSGIFYPRWSSLWTVVYIVGRQLYSMGYQSYGAGGRIYGTVLLDVSLVVLLITAIYGTLGLLNII